MEKSRYTKTRFIGGAIILGAGAFVLFTLAVMWLWNWLMPTIFSLGVIGFWQAAGLLLLSKIFFGCGGHSPNWHSDRKKKFWHSRFEEKWSKIPEEKRAEFARKMEEKGFHRNFHHDSDESEEKQNDSN